ncbi:hypothetical protein ACWOC1_13970 [Enterococcus quebecensis]|uniref:DUF5105 domain-containing protein n=1 Tax=Enterococcus quebecensis TaxID=903983 RepID=A0A1E5GWK6_9ENTE|nr:hypothetical protein [Enterococcus quebecensis]OEG16985.1 hypothetical protein BCR23_02965 [Enterococcus quebecensis]OJG75352.1 hypothetical protein RV12_GL001155 [Enterococcus quebecensis]
MKKQKVFIMLVFMVVVLTGCAKSADPKDVTTAFINNAIYGIDKEEAEKYFYKLEVPSQADLVRDFSELFDLSKEQAEELVTIYQERLEKETSFSVKIKDTTSKKQKAQVSVTGLDQTKFDQIVDQNTDEELVQWLKKKGHDKINHLDDIDKISDEKQLNDILKELNTLNDKDLNQIQFEALKKTFKELKAASKPKTIHLELEPDKKEKKYWIIVDEEKRFNELLDAFQG